MFLGGGGKWMSVFITTLLSLPGCKTHLINLVSIIVLNLLGITCNNY